MDRAHLRRDAGHGDPRVTPLELFFDLVFVFAVTQVSHLLLENLSWEGTGQATLILLVIWWSWNYTTWATNELNPEAIPVRLMIFGLMLASLLMAVAIPEAFGDRAVLFVGSYLALQIGRHLFLTFASGSRGTVERFRAGRILTWFIVSGVFWLAGALAEGEARIALWLIALAIDYTGPLLVYWVPWGRRLDAHAWDVVSEHFAERFQLFVIIALGESIVVTGATTSALDLDTTVVLALVVAFFSTAAMWWLYFNLSATMSQRHLELTSERTKMARDAYTYLHVVIVAGVIVSAVGDELIIAHPSEHLHGAELIAVVAGPALYLLSLVLLRLRITGSTGFKRLIAAAACLIVGLIGGELPALAVGSLLVAILIAVIVAEQISSHRSAARGEAAPREKLEMEAMADPGGMIGEPAP